MRTEAGRWHERPAPTVDVDLGAAVGGWVVRGLPGLLVLALVALLGGGAAAWTVGGVSAALVTWRPRSPVAPLTALLVGGWVLVGGDLLAPDRQPTGALRLAAVVLALDLLLRVSALSSHVAWRAVVELRVLGRTAREALPAQVLVQLVLVLAALLRGAPATGGAQWWRLVAVVAGVGVVLLVVSRVRR